MGLQGILHISSWSNLEAGEVTLLFLKSSNKKEDLHVKHQVTVASSFMAYLELLLRMMWINGDLDEEPRSLAKVQSTTLCYNNSTPQKYLCINSSRVLHDLTNNLAILANIRTDLLW